MKKMYEIKLYAQEKEDFKVKEIEMDTDKVSSEIQILEPTPLVVGKIIFKLPRVAPYDTDFKERMEDLHFGYLIVHENELEGKKQILEMMQKLVDNKMQCQFEENSKFQDYFKMILNGHQRYIDRLTKSL